ncbi:unnamed protein product, partial [Arabidopsis halleri]
LPVNSVVFLSQRDTEREREEKHHLSWRTSFFTIFRFLLLSTVTSTSKTPPFYSFSSENAKPTFLKSLTDAFLG